MTNSAGTPEHGEPAPELPGGTPLPDPSDSIYVLRRAQTGDRAALDEFVRRYEPRLSRIVRARMSPEVAAHVEAVDIVQLTLQSAVTLLPAFEAKGGASVIHWLSTIALRKIHDEVDRLRAAKRDIGREVHLDALRASASASAWQPAADDTTPSAALFRKELEALFDAAVNALPEDQREVVIQRDYCGLDWAEIAAQLGRDNTHAARQLHQRAWISLRRTLGPKLRSSC